MQAGEIYRHEEFYIDSTSGQLLPKYLVILAAPTGADLVVRLVTSRYGGSRPRQPPCHHGDPYPGFFLGVPGHPLDRESWLDLRSFDDLDADQFVLQLRKGKVRRVGALAGPLLRDALECAAGADDTTRAQERHIRDSLALLL